MIDRMNIVDVILSSFGLLVLFILSAIIIRVFAKIIIKTFFEEKRKEKERHYGANSRRNSKREIKK